MSTPARTTNVHQRFLERAREAPDAVALTGAVQVSRAELAAACAAVQRASAGHDRVVCPLEPALDLLATFIGVGAAGRTAIVPDAGWDPARGAEALGAIPGAATVPVDVGGQEAEPAVVVDPRLPFYVGFTSGSTGRPKAFVRGHRSWIETMGTAESAFGLSGNRPILIAAPLSLSLGLWAACQALWLGSAAVVPRRLSPHAIAREIEVSRPGVVVGVPTLLVATARLLERGGPAQSVERVLLAGQRIGESGEAAILSAFPSAAVHDFYGASELSFVSARRVGSPSVAGGVGHVLPGVEVSIRGDGAAVGGAGEIWVRSEMLFDGYLEGEAIVRGPSDRGWASVGDMGRLVDGELVLEGRGDQMYVVSGVNVFAEEVETALRAHPGVSESCVVGRPDEARDLRLVAAIEPVDGGADERELRAWVAARLRPEARPREYAFLPAIPRTSSGKPDRSAVREAVATGPQAGRAQGT